MRNLEKKQDDQLIFIQKLIENSKDDNKVLFEKLKLMVNNNVNQLEILSQEHSKKEQTITELENKNSYLSDSLLENEKKLNKLEDFSTLSSRDLSQKLNEMKTMFLAFNNNFKPEIQGSLKNFKELIGRLEDQEALLKEKVELIGTQIKKILQDSDKNKLEFKVKII